MIAPTIPHPADVQGHLQVGTRKFPLSRMSPLALGLRQPVDLPPTEAMIVLTFDDDEQWTRVVLDEGSSATSASVPYRKV